MPRNIFPLDSARPFTEQEKPGHNRYHPDIPPVENIKPGEKVRIDCREWFDGFIKNDDSAQDILEAPMSKVHALSGPFRIEGAKPGDLLIVDIMDVGPIPQETGPLAGQSWGYTGIFAKKNGGSFLVDQFPDAYKAVWDFSGQRATSRHVPGVSFMGLIHPGLMATAPSRELLNKWNKREGDLIATDPHRLPPLALPPEPQDAILGSLEGEAFDKAAREGARTAPPRENGGNQDIKNLSKGSRVFYPVYVDGANFSVGDLHFSQGDGEITFCGGIEMSGFVDLRFDIIPGGMEKYEITENAIFMPGNVEPRHSQWLSFSGTSVTLDGEQRYLDAHLAYQRACLHAIDYLSTFGWSREQAYLLLGAAPVEGQYSSVVDIPNACASIFLPLDIFDIDIRPSAGEQSRIDPGIGAPRAAG